MNKQTIVIGVLAGGALTAAAVLMATSSGKDVRGQAKNRKDTLMDTFKVVKTEGAQLKDQITKTSKEGTTLIKDLTAEVKTSIESWKNTIEPHQKNIQQYLAQIEESLKELEEKTGKQKSDSNQ